MYVSWGGGGRWRDLDMGYIERGCQHEYSHSMVGGGGVGGMSMCVCVCVPV